MISSKIEWRYDVKRSRVERSRAERSRVEHPRVKHSRVNILRIEYKFRMAIIESCIKQKHMVWRSFI